MRPTQIGGEIKSFLEVSNAINDLSRELSIVLSNGLTFADNLDAVSFSIGDTGAAGTANKIDHGLGRNPTSFIITNQDGAGSIYTSGGNLGFTSGAVVFCSENNLSIEGYIF